MIARTARAWLAAALALLVAAAGMSALTTSSSSSSLVRIGVAAGVLSAYAAAVAIVTTPRTERTPLRCLLWGTGVPLVVAGSNLVLVAPLVGMGQALLSALPWLLGAGLVSLLGPVLPSLRLPAVISSAVASGRQRRRPDPRR